MLNIKKNTKNTRQSNFELLRIILMLMIVIHHYCVNSGFDKLIDLNNITNNTILIQFMSIGGKVAVNTFILISGYFMINSKVSIIKIIKLIFQIIFYNIVVMIFLMILGYNYEVNTIIKDLGTLIFSYPETFIGSYLLVYILSSIINKMVKSINESEYLLLIGVLIFYFSILGTLFNRNTWNYFGWTFTMYIIGAYIRLYDKKIYGYRKIWVFCTVFNIGIIWMSQLFVDFVGIKYNLKSWDYMMTNANKLPVLLMAISIFLIFKNIDIKYNKFINILGASSFGVLMIHANSNTMRQWLWKDLLNNTGYFNSKFLWLHMIISVMLIYIICVTIDILRVKFLEIPLFNYIEKKISIK